MIHVVTSVRERLAPVVEGSITRLPQPGDQVMFVGKMYTVHESRTGEYYLTRPDNTKPSGIDVQKPGDEEIATLSIVPKDAPPPVPPPAPTIPLAVGVGSVIAVKETLSPEMRTRLQKVAEITRTPKEFVELTPILREAITYADQHQDKVFLHGYYSPHGYLSVKATDHISPSHSVPTHIAHQLMKSRYGSLTAPHILRDGAMDYLHTQALSSGDLLLMGDSENYEGAGPGTRMMVYRNTGNYEPVTKRSGGVSETMCAFPVQMAEQVWQELHRNPRYARLFFMTIADGTQSGKQSSVHLDSRHYDPSLGVPVQENSYVFVTEAADGRVEGEMLSLQNGEWVTGPVRGRQASALESWNRRFQTWQDDEPERAQKSSVWRAIMSMIKDL